KGHLDSQVSTLRLPPIPWNKEMLPQFFQIQAGAVVLHFNGYLAISFLHPYLDTIGVFHGVADNILQDDFHGIRLKGKDQGTPAFLASTTVYLHLDLFIHETQRLQFFYAMDQDRVKVHCFEMQGVADKGLKEQDFLPEGEGQTLGG